MSKRRYDEERDPARQAEIEKLVAEQEADDTHFESPRGAVALDAPLGSEDAAFNLHDVLDGDEIAQESQRVAGVVTAKDWRHLREKRGWTYQAIADAAGVQVQTVRHHISKNEGYRASGPQHHLTQRLSDLRAAYEAGASLRELAQIHYAEAGYRSWQSCYQGLRTVFKRHGVEIRPQHAPKHGMRSREATPGQRKEYFAYRNRLATQQRREKLIRCDAVTKEGRPCRRWAVLGGRYCMNHDERTKRPVKWTQEVIISALQRWTAEQGRPPQAKDWQRASDEHPSFKTVVDVFGKWNFALYEAGLRKRKHPKKRTEGRQARLNKGYKPCDREGCENTVPPTWRYCRDRRCQDARTQAQFNGLGS